MKRRRRRRRANRPFLPILAALAAAAVLAGAVALIVHGDVTPRPVAHVARHRHHPREIAATTAPEAPPAAATAVTPAPVAQAPTTAPTSAATTTPVPAVSEPAGAVVPTASPAAAVPAPVPTSPPSAAPSAAPTATPKPAAAAPGAPRLAIIIDDCGQWLTTERGFIALPEPLTLSVLPHVRYGGLISREALAAGKGVILHLPMEPRSEIDPGPGEISTSMSDAAIARQVDDDIASVPLAIGANNHEGSRATSDDRVMRDVSAVLAQHHYFFVDSRTSAATVAQRDAAAAGIPTASRDVFLDDVADVAATEDQLRRAAAIAREHGSAIAIGHPRPTTLVAVRALLPELRREGIDFVLARDLVR
ncbi:MAG TPA: divergent polysaccharide deacetylase family protein [Candidatus Limnocylindria bacterium]|nr:divergent polysaccharide deacetylase family protein [Candidatus Limnocylindria bacterium]